MTITVNSSGARDYFMAKNYLCAIDNPVTSANYTRVSNARITYIELVVCHV